MIEHYKRVYGELNPRLFIMAGFAMIRPIAQKSHAVSIRRKTVKLDILVVAVNLDRTLVLFNLTGVGCRF
jgi:hypothetical protein